MNVAIQINDLQDLDLGGNGKTLPVPKCEVKSETTIDCHTSDEVNTSSPVPDPMVPDLEPARPSRRERLTWAPMFLELAQSLLLVELIATPIVIASSQSSWLSYFIGIWMVRHLNATISLLSTSWRMPLRVLVELFTLAWFILGIVWLFSNAQTDIAHEPVFLYSAYLIVSFFAPVQSEIVCRVNLVLGACVASCIGACRRGQTQRDLRKVLRQLGTRPVTADDLTDSPMCTICLANFVAGEQRMKLNCQHWFHPQCVEPWLEEHGTCPLCRQPIQSGQPSSITSLNPRDLRVAQNPDLWFPTPLLSLSLILILTLVFKL